MLADIHLYMLLVGSLFFCAAFAFQRACQE